LLVYNQNEALLDGRPTLAHLVSIQHQQEAVVKAVIPNIQRSAWYSFNEMIIQTLLCSVDQEERISGVKSIV